MCGPTSPHSAMQLTAFCGVAAGIRESLFSLSGIGTWRLGGYAETLWIDETKEVWGAHSVLGPTDERASEEYEAGLDGNLRAQL